MSNASRGLTAFLRKVAEQINITVPAAKPKAKPLARSAAPKQEKFVAQPQPSAPPAGPSDPALRLVEPTDKTKETPKLSSSQGRDRGKFVHDRLDDSARWFGQMAAWRHYRFCCKDDDFIPFSNCESQECKYSRELLDECHRAKRMAREIEGDIEAAMHLLEEASKQQQELPEPPEVKEPEPRINGAVATTLRRGAIGEDELVKALIYVRPEDLYDEDTPQSERRQKLKMLCDRFYGELEEYWRGHPMVLTRLGWVLDRFMEAQDYSTEAMRAIVFGRFRGYKLSMTSYVKPGKSRAALGAGGFEEFVQSIEDWRRDKFGG